MRTNFLPFSRPSITESDIAAVVEVLQSGWITTGSKAAEFEKNICDYTGCRGAVALTSATAGMRPAGWLREEYICIASKRMVLPGPAKCSS